MPETALPARKGVKSFFWGAPGGLCVSFLDVTDPRRAATPKKWPTAGADGLKQRLAPSPVGYFVARFSFVSLLQFSRRENMGCAFVCFVLTNSQ